MMMPLQQVGRPPPGGEGKAVGDCWLSGTGSRWSGREPAEGLGALCYRHAAAPRQVRAACGRMCNTVDQGSGCNEGLQVCSRQPTSEIAKNCSLIAVTLCAGHHTAERQLPHAHPHNAWPYTRRTLACVLHGRPFRLALEALVVRWVTGGCTSGCCRPHITQPPSGT